jgi:hypothetical protein
VPAAARPCPAEFVSSAANPAAATFVSRGTRLGPVCVESLTAFPAAAIASCAGSRTTVPCRDRVVGGEPAAATVVLPRRPSRARANRVVGGASSRSYQAFLRQPHDRALPSWAIRCRDRPYRGARLESVCTPSLAAHPAAASPGCPAEFGSSAAGPAAATPFSPCSLPVLRQRQVVVACLSVQRVPVPAIHRPALHIYNNFDNILETFYIIIC